MRELIPKSNTDVLLECSHRSFIFKTELDKQVTEAPQDVYPIHACEDIRVWHKKGRTIQRYFHVLRGENPKREEPTDDFERELAQAAQLRSQEAAESLEWEAANLGKSDVPPEIPF